MCIVGIHKSDLGGVMNHQGLGSENITLTESLFMEQGMLVGGIDESGTSALAGPILVAGVVLKPTLQYSYLVRDCKTLNDEDLAEAYSEVRKKAFSIEIQIIQPCVIDSVASYVDVVREKMTKIGRDLLAFALFIDYHPISVPVSFVCCSPKMDTMSINCAAASIVAKYERDQMMVEYGKAVPWYGWERNKGASTKEHIAAIEKHGLNYHHRKHFCKRWIIPQ